ncbi:GPW/gp25 family protein [Caballeronia sp. HLA56]
MRGMNATTGRWISSHDHLYQSIGKIVSTPLASCLKRRNFGSEFHDLIDAPVNGATRTRLYAAVATALMRWEPRLTLTRVLLVGDEAEQGALYLEIEGWANLSGAPVRTRIDAISGRTV